MGAIPSAPWTEGSHFCSKLRTLAPCKSHPFSPVAGGFALLLEPCARALGFKTSNPSTTTIFDHFKAPKGSHFWSKLRTLAPWKSHPFSPVGKGFVLLVQTPNPCAMEESSLQPVAEGFAPLSKGSYFWSVLAKGFRYLKHPPIGSSTFV